MLKAITHQEDLNFLLTNRIPRQLATRFMGWYSNLKSPALTKVSIKIWQLFADDLRLEEAANQNFESLHQCFTRSLVPGARTVDQRTDIVVSPCDAIVGSCGKVVDGQLFQAKGFPYKLEDLVPDEATRRKYHNGRYVTLRLKSSMYHRFHAPLDCALREVTYISGDTWNVNPVALKRVENLFCKNERAVLDLDTGAADSGLCLVAVAAILVASIRMHCLEQPLNLRYRGPNRLPCDASFTRGEEMGYFEHGSTIILFSTPDYELCPDIETGKALQMGQALLRQSNPAALTEE